MNNGSTSPNEILPEKRGRMVDHRLESKGKPTQLLLRPSGFTCCAFQTTNRTAPPAVGIPGIFNCMNTNHEIKMTATGLRSLQEAECAMLETIRQWLSKGATIRAIDPTKPTLVIQSDGVGLFTNMHLDFSPNNHPQPTQTE